jgi:hypothetical protein
VPQQLVAALSVETTTTTTTTPTTTTTTTTAPPRTKPRAAPKPTGDGKNDTNKRDTRPAPKPAGMPLGTPFAGKETGTDIEGFARYEGQSTCDPTPKPGTVALRDLLLARYANTGSLGISRECDVGGQSEHKEGRAFDWAASVNDAADVASANDFLNALFATDAQGHKFALARRMGIMYVIWNRQIWGAYQADEGWRAYDGENPHTDHVHISMSWAGARGETSFWDGSVVTGLPDGLPHPHPPRTTTTVAHNTTTTFRGHHHDPTSTTSTTRPATTSTVVATTTTAAG